MRSRSFPGFGPFPAGMRPQFAGMPATAFETGSPGRAFTPMSASDGPGADAGREPGRGPRRGDGGRGRGRGGHHHRGRRGGPQDGPAFGRRPRPRRGDVRVAVLELLAEQPMHGYQLLGELASRSGGVWRPSPGSIYPMLALLEDEGLVRPEESEGRKVFHLTDTGRVEAERAAAERTAAGRRAPWDLVADEADDGLVGLQESAHQVLAAAAQVAQVGTTDQVGRARAVLVQARQSLYRLLAEDDSTDAGGPAAG